MEIRTHRVSRRNAAKLPWCWELEADEFFVTGKGRYASEREARAAAGEMATRLSRALQRTES